MTKNISVLIDKDYSVSDPNKKILVTSVDSPKPIISVNGVRLKSKEVQELISEAEANDRPLEKYLQSIPDALLFARNEETEITFEDHDNDIVVIPHGNAKEVAKPNGKAFIVSPIDQSKTSFEFFKNATGAELKAFFNAAAQTAKQEGLNLSELFAVIHIQDKNNFNIVSPQKYAHMHLTDENNIRPEILNNRTFVPHPNKHNHRFVNAIDKFFVMDLPSPMQESKEHSLIYNKRSMPEMLSQGTEGEWEDWRNTLFAHDAFINAVQNGGARLVIENDVMHIHGGEPLWQGKEKTRWSQTPSSP